MHVFTSKVVCIFRLIHLSVGSGIPKRVISFSIHSYVLLETFSFGNIEQKTTIPYHLLREEREDEREREASVDTGLGHLASDTVSAFSFFEAPTPCSPCAKHVFVFMFESLVRTFGFMSEFDLTRRFTFLEEKRGGQN